MSYAEVAASGPKQTPEEARAPAPPQVEHTTNDSVQSLVDVDSPHISSVTSDFTDQDVKTTTQAERREHEEEDRERAAAAKKKAQDKAQKAKSKAAQGKVWAQENKSNPVVLGNALVYATGLTALGVGAYKKYSKGELDWKLAGIWTGAVGLFATADYFVSRWLFQKYPTK